MWTGMATTRILKKVVVVVADADFKVGFKMGDGDDGDANDSKGSCGGEGGGEERGGVEAVYSEVIVDDVKQQLNFPYTGSEEGETTTF
ncbi:Hypothetical predicted protein [Octopus vulgaris]|uniref:Uncharacterized protein n=1 Tax=Octopus vulgaris TaxID=6645 RepID=A0AA36BMS2_OCTVU|nr:Hypothetical predicted protein [Octopus vulgaris]